jgi:undecaprenyl-diphosphatase
MITPSFTFQNSGDSLSIIQSFILGIVQALTEFLPVSSSGHLVIVQDLLGGQTGGDAAFEVAVHMGTLLSILVILRREVASLMGGFVSVKYRYPSWREEVTFILLSAIPAGIIGVLFKDELEHSFGNLKGVGIALILTGVLLLTTRNRAGTRQSLSIWDSLWIGLAQAVAILPGVSRSGSTISVALWLGIQRERAAKLSFLMSLPVIGGAGLLKGLDLAEQPISSAAFISLIVGTTSSFVFGLFALRLMLRWISRPSFAYFGVYCIGAGSLAILLAL